MAGPGSRPVAERTATSTSQLGRSFLQVQRVWSTKADGRQSKYSGEGGAGFAYLSVSGLKGGLQKQDRFTCTRCGSPRERFFSALNFELRLQAARFAEAHG
jgi:hypothetical protein